MVVGRQGGESLVVHWFADGKVIQALVPVICQTQYVVNSIVKETPDTGSPHAVGFGIQIQDLADHAAFPEKLAVGTGPIGDRVLESGDHSQGEGTVPGDILVSADHHGLLPEVTFFKQK